MNTDDSRELKIMIRRIAEQVIRRILEPDKTEKGTLAMIPSYVPDIGPLKEYLKSSFPDGLVCAGEGAGLVGEGSTVSAETQLDKQKLMESLKGCANVLLVSPPLWMLKNIANGDDRGFFEQAFVRALLWNKSVTVVLDFEKPHFMRGTYFEGLNDALLAIENMGAKVKTLKLSVGKPEGQYSLVTETEIVDAYKQHKERIRCEAGAIVTPLARDAAKELGVLIDE
jgi:hypothetical protein